MRKVILWILLLILISMMIGISYCVFVIVPKKDLAGLSNPSNTDVIHQKDTDDLGNHQTVTWTSYQLDVIEDGIKTDSVERTNYYLIVGDVTITICTIEPNNCDAFKYKKNDKEYVAITDNERLIKANFKIFDDVDDGGYPIIKVNRTLEDGAIAVFYFKKSV